MSTTSHPEARASAAPTTAHARAANQLAVIARDLMLTQRIFHRSPRAPVNTLTPFGPANDRVQARNDGVSGCLETRFAPGALEARIPGRVVIGARGASGHYSPTRHRAGPVDLRRSYPRGNVLLSNKAFALLPHFMALPGQLLSHRRPLCAIWGYEHDPSSDILDLAQHVACLWRELGPGRQPILIRTVRNRGYLSEHPTIVPAG